MSRGFIDPKLGTILRLIKRWWHGWIWIQSDRVVNVNWNADSSKWNVNTWKRDDDRWNRGPRVFRSSN